MNRVLKLLSLISVLITFRGVFADELCKGSEELFRQMTKMSLRATNFRCRVGQSVGRWFIVREHRRFLTDIDGNNLIDDAELLELLFNFGRHIEETKFTLIGSNKILDDFYLSCVYLPYFGSRIRVSRRICVTGS
ncbi:MAG: hypothetical protein N2654_04070 [Deltaproteobacteria bacterium]|nr:hypothetical protein [Deltaproteobacteria bacterium]